MSKNAGPPQGPTNLYVIGESDEGPVKIGIGASPEKRLGELQVGNPRTLHLYTATWHESAVAIEAWLQRNLKADHIRGEWYSISPEAAAHVIAEAVCKADEGGISALVRTPNLRETDGRLERYCGLCRRWLDLSQFYPSHIKATKTQVRCKSCARDYQRSYRERPGVKERHAASERRRKRRIRAKQGEKLFPGMEE